MTNQVLTPTALVPDGGGLDLTALLAAPTQTTLQWSSTGREFLLCSAATTSLTVTVNVGSTVLGQAVSAFTPIALTNGHITAVGPFHSVLNQPGTQTVTVTLSSTTSITVALLQLPGVY